MRWSRLIALVLCALGTPPVALAADSEPGQTLNDRLAAGEVIVTPHHVEGFSVVAVTVDAVIDVPPERVWAMVTACPSYRSIMPHVVESVQAEHAGDRRVCKWSIDMPFPFSDMATFLEFKSAPVTDRWYADFHQLRGDFVRNEGYWRLERFGTEGKRTRVTFRQHSVMDIAVPASMVKRGHIQAMHEMIAKMRAGLK